MPRLPTLLLYRRDDPRRPRAHPHAAAVLRRGARRPPGARLPAPRARGTGKREAARAFAAELLAEGAPIRTARARACSTAPIPTSPGSRRAARTRCCGATSTRPWSAAAAHTPFEAPPPRVRARARRHDERRGGQRAAQDARGAAGLRRPAAAHRPARPGAADDRLALPARALRPAVRRTVLAARLEARGVAPGAGARPRRASASATGSARSRSRSATGPRCAPTPRRFARAAAARPRRSERPWRRAAGARRRRRCAPRATRSRRGSREELEFLPRKEHRRRETEDGEQSAPAPSGARETAALDHGLQLAGLWYRDLACVAAGAPELVHHADRADALREDAEGRRPRALREAVELVEDTRARLALNVSEELALRGARLPARARVPFRPGPTSG